MKKGYIICMLLAIALILLLICIQNVHSREWYEPDETGIETQISWESPYIKQSEPYNHTAKRILVDAGKFIDTDKRFKLEGELFLAFHRAEAEVPYTDDVDGKEIGFYVIPKYYWHTKYTDLYIGVPLGVSHLLDENQPNLGDSGLLGSFGVVIGADTVLNKNWNLRTEFRSTHTSDPFSGDSGRNLHGILLGVIYKW